MSKHAIDTRLLLLIRELARIDYISSTFYLAGGTALAIQLKHRKSDDIDLFSQSSFNPQYLINEISRLNATVLIHEKDTVHLLINDVKVSFFHYPHSLIAPLESFEGIKMANIKDLACMKVIAIAQRAEKKDFFDMYELLQIFTPYEIKEMFLQKYGKERANCYHILKSFFYFNDAEGSAEPVSLKGITWDDVKRFFIENERTLTDSLLC